MYTALGSQSGFPVSATLRIERINAMSVSVTEFLVGFPVTRMLPVECPKLTSGLLNDVCSRTLVTHEDALPTGRTKANRANRNEIVFSFRHRKPGVTNVRSCTSSM